MLRDVELILALRRFWHSLGTGRRGTLGPDTWTGPYLGAATPWDPDRRPPARTRDPSSELVPSTTRSAHRVRNGPPPARSLASRLETAAPLAAV